MFIEKEKKSSLSWINLFLITLLAAYLFIFNEWLFAVTKPSFLNSLDLLQQLDILLTTSALLASLCFFGLLPLVIASFFPTFKARLGILIKLGGLLPAVIFATLILMMVDNFTYTVIKWGIVSTDGWSRGLYGLSFILLIAVCYRRVINALVYLSLRKRIWVLAPTRIFTLMIIVLLLPMVFRLTLISPVAPSRSLGGMPVTSQLPDILIITSDGVSATHMSVYGYARDTTPHIRQLAQFALVAENAFPNSGKTSGSLASLFTGKYPAETRLLISPDVLEGNDAYEHLPSILHSLGYRTIQIASRYYSDANTLNIVDGFDEVKTRSGVSYSKYIGAISNILPYDKALFVDEISNRVIDRIRHIFFVQKMVNPYLMVTDMAEPLLDMERLEMIKHELRTSKQPVFIHVHLMGTHGPKYNVTEQKYSADQAIESQALWTDDFYDDSILEFDKYVGEMIDFLSERDLLDNTLLIVGSDHGQKWDPIKRIPLIIRFPHEKYAGRIQANVQILDIAPTILDYIGVQQPEWMHGKSLIAGGLDERLIYGMTAIDPEDLGPTEVVVIEGNPSFENLYFNTLIHCNRWFDLDSYHLAWETGLIEGSTSTCQSEISDEQAFQLIVEHLDVKGIDVSHLATFSP